MRKHLQEAMARLQSALGTKTWQQRHNCACSPELIDAQAHGMAKEHAWSMGGTALDTKAHARLHLREKPISPCTSGRTHMQEGRRLNEWLMEVMARHQSTRGTGKLGNGGNNCACRPEPIDARARATGLVVDSVRMDLPRLGSTRHAGLDGSPAGQVRSRHGNLRGLSA